MAGIVTLNDYAQVEKDALRKSVIDTFLMEADLMKHVPWETIGRLGTTLLRYKNIPSVAFRKINTAWTAAKGETDQRTEVVKDLGGMVDVDKLLVRAGGTVESVRAIQQYLQIKAMAYEFNDKFINGDPTVTPDEIMGILKRVDGLNAAGYTSQYIDLGLTTDEGILHDSASMNAYVDHLEELVHAIDGHSPDCLLMNGSVLLATRSILRRLQLLDTTKDQFGRVITMFGKVPIYDVGVKADQTTQIITTTETLGMSTGVGSSVYAVKFGIGTHLWGIQTYALEVKDKGELEDGVTFRTVVDWPLGLAIMNPRSIARLYGVSPTVTAS